MLSQLQGLAYKRRNERMYVNYEMGRLGTEVIVAYFRVLQNYSFGGE
jgi:hypothetical protein